MSGTEVAISTTARAPSTAPGALAVRADQTEWTPAQKAALEQLGISEASRGDLDVFLHVSQRMGLDPFAKEIYMIGRWDPELRRKRWTIQVGIDGFRSKSEEHPQFAGVSDAEWCGPDGQWRDVWTADEPPVAARITVYRRDWAHPVRAVAHYREYVQTKADGSPTAMWKTRAAGQLAKCAEALARRRAFPRLLGGVYAPEELAHLSNPQHVTIPEIPDPARVQHEQEPNWVALVAQAEHGRDLTELKRVWDMAKGMRPNDTELLERIAQAAHRVRTAAHDDPENGAVEAQDVEPAGRAQRNRLFALLREGNVSGTDRVMRLRIVSRVLNRPPAQRVMSFDDLTAREVDTINDFLQRHKDEGDLIHTLAELGGAGDSPPLDSPQEGATTE